MNHETSPFDGQFSEPVGPTEPSSADPIPGGVQPRAGIARGESPREEGSGALANEPDWVPDYAVHVRLPDTVLALRDEFLVAGMDSQMYRKWYAP